VPISLRGEEEYEKLERFKLLMPYVCFFSPCSSSYFVFLFLIFFLLESFDFSFFFFFFFLLEVFIFS
jgi:hypothetical protein